MTAPAAAWSAFRLQTALTRRSPGNSLVLITAPLFAVIFISLARASGNRDDLVNAVLAPGLIGVWAICLDVAGSVVDADRWEGRLEALIGTPTSLATVVFGRICSVVIFGALTFVESWLVAVLGFRIHLTVEHPWIFVAAVVATCFAAAATATLLSAAFVLSRGLHVYQNSLSYPIYILGGILVPVATLPGWLGPPSRVVFLSWSAALMRDSTRSAAVDDWPGRLLIILGLGAVALGGGVLLIRSICNRLRATGDVTRA